MVVAGTYDSLNFTAGGIAGVFAVYPGVSHLGRIFLTEFVAVRSHDGSSRHFQCSDNISL
jgi:glycerol uptake facilitator-like aquaporin